MDVHLADGDALRFRQPHMRGGRKEPLGWDDIWSKFDQNAAHAGLSDSAAGEFANSFLADISERSDVGSLRDFRPALGA
jgi:hypothetical protein